MLCNVSFAVASRPPFREVQGTCPNIPLSLAVTLRDCVFCLFRSQLQIRSLLRSARVNNPSPRLMRCHVHMTQPASKRRACFLRKFGLLVFPDSRSPSQYRSRQPLTPPCNHKTPLSCAISEFEELASLRIFYLSHPYNSDATHSLLATQPHTALNKHRLIQYHTSSHSTRAERICHILHPWVPSANDCPFCATGGRPLIYHNDGRRGFSRIRRAYLAHNCLFTLLHNLAQFNQRPSSTSSITWHREFCQYFHLPC